MKKIIFLIGSFVFIFFLVSCSPGKAVDETDPSEDFFPASDEESNSDKQTDNGQESVERTQTDNGQESVERTQTDNGQESVERTQTDNGQESVERTQTDNGQESVERTQTDNGQESVERTQTDNGESPPPNTFVIPELEITGDDHPIPSQEPETKYVCKKEGQSASYSIYKPGIANNSHICELDTSSTPSPADWRAFNQADYCDNKLSEIIAEKQAQGFVCSQEN